jgi:hypothetical protein
MYRPSLPPGISWYSFRKAESTPGTRTCRMPRKKSPVIDPGTFRLVAQRLNHYATPGPILSMSVALITQRAMRMRRIIFSYALSGCIVFVHIISQTAQFSEKKTSLSPQTCVLILS